MGNLKSTAGIVGPTSAEGLSEGGPTPIVEPIQPLVGKVDEDTESASAKTGTDRETNTRNDGLTFKAYEFGISSINKDIVIPEKLKHNYEGILDTIASQLKEYQMHGATAGNNLTEEQREFLKIYENQKDKLLTTADGWRYANSVIEDALFVRMAAIQKTPIIKTEDVPDKPKKISVLIHRKEGKVRTVVRMAGRVAISPIYYPVKGIIKGVESFLTNEKVEIVLSDSTIDVTTLSPEARQYIDYLNNTNIGQEDTMQFLVDAAVARKDYSVALGTDPKKFGNTAPLQDYRSDRWSSPHETVDAVTSRVRSKLYNEIVAEGKGPGGVPLHEDDSRHRDWVSYELLRRTQKELAGTFIPGVEKEEIHADTTVSRLVEKTKDLEKPITPEGLKSRQIEELRGQIAKLEGELNADNSVKTKGELQNIEQQIQELHTLLTTPQNEDKSLEQTFQEKRSTYATNQKNLILSEKELKRLQKLQKDLQARSEKIIKTAERKIKDKKDLPTYKSEENIYITARKAYEKQIEKIDKDKDALEAAGEARLVTLTSDWEKASAAGDTKQANALYTQMQNIQTLVAQQQSKLEALKTRIQVPQKSKRLQKYDQEIELIITQRDQETTRINGEATTTFSQVQTAQKDFNDKKIVAVAALKEYTPIKTKRNNLIARVNKLERDKKRILHQIEIYKKQLAEVEKTKGSKLEAKRLKGKELLQGYQIAVSRWEEIVTDVESDPTLHHAEVADLLDVHPHNPGYGKDYAKGYLNAVDVLFQWNGAESRSDRLKVAQRILPPQRYAELMYDFFDLGSVATPPTRNDLSAVLTFVDTHQLFRNQMHAGRFFNEVLKDIAHHANLVRETL